METSLYCIGYQEFFSFFSILESKANLGICHGVIMLRECLVVDERILGKDRDSLADVEV